MNSKVDFQLIDNGEFISSLYKDRQHIIAKAKETRLTESKDGKEESFEGWFDASLLIDEFEKSTLVMLIKLIGQKIKHLSGLIKIH